MNVTRLLSTAIFEVTVFETIIPRREDFSKAFIQGRPAVFDNPLLPASLAYLQLADEIIADLASGMG